VSIAVLHVDQIARLKKVCSLGFPSHATSSTSLKLKTCPPFADEYGEHETQHMQRVGTLSALLALEIGRPHCEVETLHAAAPLHDIGKIAIPNQILDKPGKLTSAEFSLVKAHTSLGCRILSGSQIPVCQLASQIALCHHERWDGKGYPEGLAGNAIPLPARITAIADVFDALTHARPYKRAWNHQQAIEFIEQESSRQFDPTLVLAFLSLMAVRRYRAEST
jgi:putative two-component system response regulator